MNLTCRSNCWGNVKHIAEHGLMPDEVDTVLLDDSIPTAYSASTGRPCKFGYTSTGKHIIVIWDELNGGHYLPRECLRSAGTVLTSCLGENHGRQKNFQENFQDHFLRSLGRCSKACRTDAPTASTQALPGRPIDPPRTRRCGAFLLRTSRLRPGTQAGTRSRGVNTCGRVAEDGNSG